MIYEGRGFLIDWELAQRTYLLNEGNPRTPDQTGTLQFLSAQRLRDPMNTPHLAVDDMESTFWVLLWLGYKYGQHNLDGETLRNELTATFDSVLSQNGFLKGGLMKLVIIQSSLTQAAKVQFVPAGFHSVLESMRNIFKPRYEPAPELVIADDDSESLIDARMKVHTASLAQYNQKLRLLDDPVKLREVIKASASLDWTGDRGFQKRDIPLPPNVVPGLSAVKGKGSSRTSSVFQPFPYAVPPTVKPRDSRKGKKADVDEDEDQDQDQDQDEDEDQDEDQDEDETGDEREHEEDGPDRPHKKLRMAEDSNGLCVSVSEAGNASRLAWSADSSHADSGEGGGMIVLDDSDDTSSDLASVDNGTGQCSNGDEGQPREDAEELAALNSDVDFDELGGVGLTSKGVNPLPPSSPAPSARSLASNGNDF